MSSTNLTDKQKNDPPRLFLFPDGKFPTDTSASKEAVVIDKFEYDEKAFTLESDGYSDSESEDEDESDPKTIKQLKFLTKSGVDSDVTVDTDDSEDEKPKKKITKYKKPPADTQYLVSFSDDDDSEDEYEPKKKISKYQKSSITTHHDLGDVVDDDTPEIFFMEGDHFFVKGKKFRMQEMSLESSKSSKHKAKRDPETHYASSFANPDSEYNDGDTISTVGGRKFIINEEKGDKTSEQSLSGKTYTERMVAIQYRYP